MPTTISSREFNHDISAAKRAAAQGPVFITDRGKPAHVLLSIRDYRRIASKGQSLLDLLTPRESLDLDFEWEPGRANLSGRAADFDA